MLKQLNSFCFPQFFTLFVGIQNKNYLLKSKSISLLEKNVGNIIIINIFSEYFKESIIIVLINYETEEFYHS